MILSFTVRDQCLVSSSRVLPGWAVVELHVYTPSTKFFYPFFFFFFFWSSFFFPAYFCATCLWNMYSLHLLAAKECLPTHIHTRSLLTRPQFIGRLLGKIYIYLNFLTVWNDYLRDSTHFTKCLLWWPPVHINCSVGTSWDKFVAHEWNLTCWKWDTDVLHNASHPRDIAGRFPAFVNEQKCCRVPTTVKSKLTRELTYSINHFIIQLMHNVKYVELVKTCGNKMPTRGNRGLFIADLIPCSTCFGHHYAHHQELKNII